MKRGFTLIEMLVVVGIIAILAGATLASFNKLTKGAEKAKAQELVHQVATALAKIWETEGNWPKRYRENVGERGGLLDKENALVLAKHGGMSFSTKKKDGKVVDIVGNDRYGIVTPWAMEVIKRLGASASLTSSVPGYGTVQDHILHFAIDVDGDGVINSVDVGGKTLDMRATVAVWCVSKDGKSIIHSWSDGQTKAVK